jgi:hypothetical protein
MASPLHKINSNILISSVVMGGGRHRHIKIQAGDLIIVLFIFE